MTEKQMVEHICGSKRAYSLCDVCARACEQLAEACDKHAEIEAFPVAAKLAVRAPKSAPSSQS